MKNHLTRWVSGSQQPASNRVEQEAVILIPDRSLPTRRHRRNSGAAPSRPQKACSPSSGTAFFIPGNSASKTTPTSCKSHAPKRPHIPNLCVQVDLVGAAPRTADATLPPRPAYATGRLRLDVPPYTRTFSLTVTPDESEVAPASETAVTIQVADSQGHQRPRQAPFSLSMKRCWHWATTAQ